MLTFLETKLRQENRLTRNGVTEKSSYPLENTLMHRHTFVLRFVGHISRIIYSVLKLIPYHRRLVEVTSHSS
jgi:hypothetical protein